GGDISDAIGALWIWITTLGAGPDTQINPQLPGFRSFSPRGPYIAETPDSPGDNPEQKPNYPNDDNDDDEDDDECAPWQEALLGNVEEVTRFFTETAPAGSAGFSTITPAIGIAYAFNFQKNANGSVSLWIGGGGQVGTGQASVTPSLDASAFSGGV